MCFRLLIQAKIVLLAELGGGNNHCGKCEERDYVGDNHQVVEHIRQLPNEVVLEDCAEEYEYNCDAAVNREGLLTKEVKEVYLTEVVPGKNRGECEEEQADCNEDRADDACSLAAAKGHRERLLRKVCLGDVCKTCKIGDTVEVLYSRDGNTYTTQLTLQEYVPEHIKNK